jgi:cell division protein ZapE
MTEGPLFRYRTAVGAGELEDDGAQRRAAEALQVLHGRLDGYRPGRRNGGGLRGILGIAAPDSAPRGLYLFGDVGRGKTMLMDVFFATAPVARKRRVHFHGFMSQTQDAIEAFRRSLKDRPGQGGDPIPPAADAIAEAASLLCFDEFQVTDIADAMILGRLFEALFARGVVVVATSNAAPGELYAGGLNRALFLPFIALIEQHMDVLHLDAARDYRMGRLLAEPVFHAPLGPAAASALVRGWAAATAGLEERATTIALKGREIVAPRTAGRAARFTFAELCEAALGPRDFLAIAERFETVFVEDVPRLDRDRRNEAQRFVMLIDTLYDAAALVFMTAAVEPSQILASVADAAPFRRAASRLHEMGSTDYLARAAARGSEGAGLVAAQGQSR